MWRSFLLGFAAFATAQGPRGLGCSRAIWCGIRSSVGGFISWIRSRVGVLYTGVLRQRGARWNRCGIWRNGAVGFRLPPGLPPNWSREPPGGPTRQRLSRWAEAGPNRADLTLAVNASREYAVGARKSGEPWVHLLVQQNFTDPSSLGEIGTARLRLEARLVKSRLHRAPDYTPELHAAQYQIFLTLQNSNRRSPGFGRFVWFGIPLYDDRARIPPEHKQRDTAGSDMFIYTPSGELFSRHSAHDGEWIQVDCDLRPLLREALETAWRRGFLDESRDLADYRLTGMNLGWEVPGVFDVELAVRGLSLTVTTAGARDR